MVSPGKERGRGDQAYPWGLTKKVSLGLGICCSRICHHSHVHTWGIDHTLSEVTSITKLHFSSKYIFKLENYQYQWCCYAPKSAINYLTVRKKTTVNTNLFGDCLRSNIRHTLFIWIQNLAFRLKNKKNDSWDFCMEVKITIFLDSLSGTGDISEPAACISNVVGLSSGVLAAGWGWQKLQFKELLAWGKEVLIDDDWTVGYLASLMWP